MNSRRPTAHVSSGRLILGQPAVGQRQDDPTWHDYITVNGLRFLRKNVGIDFAAHDGNYGTRIISGLGNWKQTNGSHAVFRLYDHVRRAILNAIAMGFKEFQNLTPMQIDDMVEAVVKQVITHFGLVTPQLTQAEDAYGRLQIVGENTALGVGSLNRGTICITSRDLTDYVPADGMTLLFPGLLFRRPNPLMGLPFLKSASNYALAYIWKSVICSWFKANEVLGLNWKGDRIAETTGSIPLAITYLPKDLIEFRIPDEAAGRLNSITTDTVIKLIEARYGNRARVRFGLGVWHLEHCNELWVMGSWSGVAPVTNVLFDQRFLPWRFQRIIPLNPFIPQRVWDDSVGDSYLRWLELHFEPEPGHEHGWHYSTQPGQIGSQIRRDYWTLVRDPSQIRRDLPQLFVPGTWHSPVELLEPELQD